MGKSLKIDQENTGTKAKLVLHGQIDEAADYATVDFNGIKAVHIDFENITLINSTGLQKWIKFLNEIPKEISVAFERCTPKIIKQIDMFPGFLASRKVAIETFYAPYFCEKCDKAANVLLKIKDVKLSHKAPIEKCETCDSEMEFDSIEKKYFMFLDHLSD